MFFELTFLRVIVFPELKTQPYTDTSRSLFSPHTVRPSRDGSKNAGSKLEFKKRKILIVLHNVNCVRRFRELSMKNKYVRLPECSIREKTESLSY